MRTLKEITDAIRRNESASYPEVRYAIVAYDVLVSKLRVERSDHQLAEFFKAAESCPKEYAGPENDPENLEAVKWYAEHINNRPGVFEMARKLLDDEAADGHTEHINNRPEVFDRARELLEDDTPLPFAVDPHPEVTTCTACARTYVPEIEDECPHCLADFALGVLPLEIEAEARKVGVVPEITLDGKTINVSMVATVAGNFPPPVAHSSAPGVLPLELTVGGKYNFIGQRQRLVYLGNNLSGNGYWHQFALVELPDDVWAEVQERELPLIEASAPSLDGSTPDVPT